MNKRRSLFLYLAVAALSATAQHMNYQRYEMAEQRQLWQQSNNAAGLAHDMRDSIDNRGIAYFDFRHRSGDYTRVQEGNQQNQLRFFTERYQKIGKYLYGYGSFDFDMGRIKERSWSDVMRTYNSNPFLSGSSIKGKYDFQNFTLNARLASVRLGHFNYGASLYYKVGDLSRLRDPRPRVRLAVYQLTPAATYTTGAHTLGLAAWYRRYKEKLTGISTISDATDLKYYTMSGVEYVQGGTGSHNGYQREYVNHQFGGELSYAFQGSTVGSLVTATYHRGTEYAYGQYKYEPGRWYTNYFELSTRQRIKSASRLHVIQAKLGYEEGYADQYNQELITQKDGAYTTQYWSNKMTYRKRYQMKKLDVNLRYRLSFVDTDDDALAGYVGASYDLQRVSNKHLLATSQLKYLWSRLGVEGGVGLLDKRFWVKGEAAYHINHKSELDLSDATTDYAQGVLIPDMPYYRANYWQAGMELMYQQPLIIKKQHTQWFAKLYGRYLHTDNSLDGREAGISVGLYY